MPAFASQGIGHTSPTDGPTQPQPVNPTDRARAYKSRNKRPCDFCRYKKAACHLERAPPCELCIRFNKECTFVESPAKRRRPNEQADKDRDSMSKRSSIAQGPQFSDGGHPTMDVPRDLLPWESAISQLQTSGMPTISSTSSMGPAFAFDPALYEESINFDPFEAISASTTTNNTNDRNFIGHHHRQSASIETSSQSQSDALAVNLHLPFASTTGEPSLDRQSSSNAQIIGMSGECDPHLLSRYRYDEYNEASFQSIRMRMMNGGSVDKHSNIPTFFRIQPNVLAAKGQQQDKSDRDEKWRRELGELVDDETGRRLIQLFCKYVQPYFPLLSREVGAREVIAAGEPSELSPCVLAAIYGHALPFCAWDEKLCVEVYTPPSADVLFTIAWLSCQPLLHTPNMAVLQTLLLLVQRRPTNRSVTDIPFKWVIMTTAVAVAQALGLNRDPTDWPLPLWEIKQRKRLAWAVYIQDKWLALTFGRSSHINADDWDVPPLNKDDFPEAQCQFSEDPKMDFSCTHFIKLCELTLIVNDILGGCFSVKATRQLHSSLDDTLEVARPLRIRLSEWFQALPVGLLPCQGAASTVSIGSPGSTRLRSVQLELDGNGSLQLAYIIAKIELFRAMLRPRVTDSTAAAVIALRKGALAVAKEMSDFLEALDARELEAFWASYSRTNFAIASSFMLLLFITSPSVSDAKECLQLLHAWRRLLRNKSPSCDLLNPALLQLDGVFVADMDRVIELSSAAQEAWAEAGLEAK